MHLLKNKLFWLTLIILGIASAFIFLPKITALTTQISDKEGLKPPPHFKTIKEIKGIDEVKLTTESGKVKYPHDYVIVMLGDSMTERLGNSDELKGYLNQYYPKKAFEVLNYGFGSTNILSAPDRLLKDTFYFRTFRPITDIAFDVILIESFGNNPLSDYPLEEGLKKQTETLDQMVQILKEKSPKAKVVFVSTVAPSKYYAREIVQLTVEQRAIWLKERIAYIQNHMAYARSHNIPLIDIYDKSLNPDGTGKDLYIDEHDHIHPSPKGILFISKEIADFLAQNNYFQN